MIICLAAGITVIGIVASCRIHQTAGEDSNGTSRQSGSSWSLSPLEMFNAVPNEYILKFKTSDENAVKIAALREDECQAFLEGTNIDLHFRTQLNSAFGVSSITFAYPSAADSLSMSAKIGESGPTFQFPVQRPIATTQLAKACQGANSESINILEDDQLKGHIVEWMASAAPDCTIETKDSHFYCRIDSIDPALARKELQSLQRTMIRRWSRQPYVLTRRVATAIMLADALKATDVEKALDSVCKVFSFSKDFELPVALATPRWREAVCEPTSSTRIEAAEIGLAKTFAEVEFSRQLFERTSKLGILTVRIPKELAPSKDLWVSLQPQVDVATNLAEFEGSPKKNSKVEEVAEMPACWHPLFDPNAKEFTIARHIELVGAAESLNCRSSDLTGEPWKIPAAYLADSITSETEFVITNGRSKLLRLPAGNYVYSVRAHSEDMEFEEVPEGSTSGTIVWKKRRPSAVIKTWR